MRIAVLSDIHSNKYSLKAAFDDLSKQNIDKCFFLGDNFGYYPWALETYQMLAQRSSGSEFILGNHDALLLQSTVPDPKPDYWDVIIDNKNKLSKDALHWLGSLISKKEITIDSSKFILCHGTPDDPLNGRYYPDEEKKYEWFPKKNEFLLMGHTHYKIQRQTPEGGIILNPGSIGQPRGKASKPSYAIIESDSALVEFREVNYDIASAISELEKMNWYPRAIDSLKRSLLN
jgi:putative phosphoesterase